MIDQQRIDEIDNEVAEMYQTLEGCDWCCGGGDERLAKLIEERRQILGLPPED